MRVEPYKAEHLLAISLQPAQAWLTQVVTPELAKALENGSAMTGLDGDEVLIVAGVADYWPGRGLLWSYVGENAHRHWKSIHAAAKKFLGMVPHDRLEATVDIGFDAGERWVQRLGFSLETPRARNYYVNGRDCRIYVKVKE